MNPNKLYKGDCLEVMKTIKSGSIDAIITDPPYGTTACKWDSVINFDLMWEQLNRIIKPNGAIVLFGSEPFSSALRMSNIKNYKYDWIWEKEKATDHLNSKFRPMKKHELISVFSEGASSYSKNGNMKYIPQGLIDIEPKLQKRSGKKSEYTHSNHNISTIQKQKNFPTTILKINGESKNRLHPTQKPVALMEYLIKTYTKENETVLDFTMGSGSTGVACVNTNRSFIGIEKDENYFNIAKERINKESDLVGG
jgi:site-specific DNA-methyltransferase (adenine-specific)